MEFSFEELVSALEGTIVVNNDNKNFWRRKRNR